MLNFIIPYMLNMSVNTVRNYGERTLPVQYDEPNNGGRRNTVQKSFYRAQSFTLLSVDRLERNK